MAGVQVAVALFTNFTQDHLDYHGSMDAYWAAKRALFDWPGLRAAVVNVDDAKGAALAAELQAAGTLDVWTVSRAGAPARLVAEGLGYEGTGLGFTLREGDATARVASTLTGDYNVSNLLGVIGVLRASGCALEAAAHIVPMLTAVPGRMQRVAAVGGPEVVVDYAHTPDALDNAIRALKPLAAARGGALWCVFGCGGNRDPGKRPLMGAVAGRHADRVVVTSDNPRDEPPAAIVGQVGGRCRPPGRDRDRRPARGHRTRGGRRRCARRRADRRQGPRGLPGDRRRAASVLRCRRSRRGARAQEGRAMMTLEQANAMLPGSMIVGDADIRFERVHSDTRTLQAGDLFVALKGEHSRRAPVPRAGRRAGRRGGAGHARPVCGRALRAAGERHAAGAAAAGRGLAPPLRPAADRGDRQQRQDHRDADDRVDPARLAGRGCVLHRGQPQQPHRRAAHAAAPARGARRRGGRARHEPPRRDRPCSRASPRPRSRS